MATQTTYYEFNKPAGTDLVNPLVDTNPNWDIADNALHELDERSVANCTEVVSMGVHAISRLDTNTKFLKWIATANYTAGETFTVDGNLTAVATASGEALATGAYVTGAVVLACLNDDNSAMTIYVTGTNVATDSAKLGGELPSYYAKQTDMSNAQTDITNIKNLNGTTSIVAIGDGTLTGAVYSLNNDLSKLGSKIISSTTWNSVGNKTVDESISNYDFLVIESIRNNQSLYQTNIINVNDFKLGNKWSIDSNSASDNYYITIQYVDNTTIKVESLSGQYITKIYGIKFPLIN